MYGARKGTMSWKYEDNILIGIVGQQEWTQLSPQAALDAVRIAETGQGVSEYEDYILAISNPRWIREDTPTLLADVIVDVDMLLNYIDDMGVDQISAINTLSPFLRPEELDEISSRAYQQLHQERQPHSGIEILHGDDSLTKDEITPSELTVDLGSRHVRTINGISIYVLRRMPTEYQSWDQICQELERALGSSYELASEEDDQATLIRVA